MGFFRKSSIKVSVCVPVYNSETFLAQCLDSIALQNFDGLELIVVNDGSTGKDNEGNDCKKIVKAFKKRCPYSVNYIEHESNKGLAEARRTAVYAATGKYILNVDSDDFLPADAVKNLYEAAEKSGSDIVQGKAAFFASENKNLTDLNEISKELIIDLKFIQNYFELACRVYGGSLKNREIFEGFLTGKNHNGFLWGKLFLRDLYLEAFGHIPVVHCVFAEDFLQYFWLSFCAKNYTGIDAVVYNYSISSGISNGQKITDLHRWNHICSASGVFTSIFYELENLPENSISEEERAAVDSLCHRFLYDNIRMYFKLVAPEIKENAYKILNDYWGNDFVDEILAVYKNQADNNTQDL